MLFRWCPLLLHTARCCLVVRRSLSLTHPLTLTHSLTGVFENAIDMAHIHYLHNDSFGNSEKPRIHDMTTTRDTFHVEANFRCVSLLLCCAVLGCGL